MIIVISDTHLFEGEANIVDKLFDEGLAILHLRKYENTEKEIREFLKQIDLRYLDRIALHQYHHLAKEFGIKRLHFSTESRKKTTDRELSSLIGEGNYLSTSVHSLEEYKTLSSSFNYTFIGPVFDSISKQGYKAKAFDLSKLERSTTKLVALGGVNKENCARVFDLGFDGAALLGSIWRSDDKVNSYKEICLKCSTNAL